MTTKELKLHRRQRAELHDQARQAAWLLGKPVPEWIPHARWFRFHSAAERAAWTIHLNDLIERAK